MSKTIEQMVAELKLQLGDYEVTDDDFYESDDVAEFDTDCRPSDHPR